jgi:hypothetical protein
MVEAGTVKIAQGGDLGGPSSGGGGVTSSQRRGSGNSIRQTGDR